MGNIVKNSVLLGIEHDPDEALVWVKENCPSYITCDGYIVFGNKVQYYYLFSDEKDMIWFALRWG